MSDKSQPQAKNLEAWRGNPNFAPILPPLPLRSSRQEHALRQVVRKDLEGFCPAPSSQNVRPPFLPGHEPVSYNPWQFPPNPYGAVSPLVGGQTPQPHQNTLLSSDGFATDASYTETNGDPHKVAEEAEHRPANELIKEEDGKDQDKPSDPEVAATAKSKVESEEAYERSNTRWADGSRGSKQGHTSTYKESGKPIKGKYEMGASVEQKYDEKSYFSSEDKDGFAQGKTGFLNRTTKSSAGVAISDDWAGGNTNITAKAGASASASLLEMSGTLNKDGLVNANGGVDVMKGEAIAEAGVKLGAYNGSPTVTAQGKVGVDLTLAQVKGGLGVSVTPYRAGNFVVHAFNGIAEWAEWDARLGEIDKSWDWGVFIELGGEAGIGASATAEAELGTLDDGKTGFRAKAKAALGPSAGAKLGLGVQSPTK
ncbi:hypothetical protein DXT90_18870 [Agrobacterium tumefaciens]|uniref:hypothetical protein n=1 Tax=Agrobacterium cavarae TaxID=2528239 RepID=UPI0011A93513|nr:hypothetical protein [Agrobacterium cavarae]MQB22692.1 hypothetical protein [Agrobacterium tumefaciens]